MRRWVSGFGRRFDVPVVYLTGDAGEPVLRRAAASNPFGYVLRPFDPPKREPRLAVSSRKIKA